MTVKIRLRAIGLLCSIAACVNAGGEPVKLSRPAAKPYVIGIAPSHVTVSPKPCVQPTRQSRAADLARYDMQERQRGAL